MPVSFATIFRTVVFLLLTTHVFFMYQVGRDTEPQTYADYIQPAAFAAAMIVPMVWLAGIAEIPEARDRHRARRRWDEDLCPDCGYAMPDDSLRTCPECGTVHKEPAPYYFGPRAIQRFLIFSFGAWVFGCAAGEVAARYF